MTEIETEEVLKEMANAIERLAEEQNKIILVSGKTLQIADNIINRIQRLEILAGMIN